MLWAGATLFSIPAVSRTASLPQEPAEATTDNTPWGIQAASGSLKSGTDGVAGDEAVRILKALERRLSGDQRPRPPVPTPSPTPVPTPVLDFVDDLLERQDSEFDGPLRVLTGSNTTYGNATETTTTSSATATATATSSATATATATTATETTTVTETTTMATMGSTATPSDTTGATTIIATATTLPDKDTLTMFPDAGSMTTTTTLPDNDTLTMFPYAGNMTTTATTGYTGPEVVNMSQVAILHGPHADYITMSFNVLPDTCASSGDSLSCMTAVTGDWTPCNLVIYGPDLPLYGIDPQCRWMLEGDKYVYYIYFGASATMEVGGIVRTVDSLYTSNRRQASGVLQATLFLETGFTPTLTAKIAATPDLTVNPCTEMFFSSEATTGAYGRPFESVTWSVLTPSSTCDFGAALVEAAANESANLWFDKDILYLNPSVLRNAYDFCTDVTGFEVGLGVRNWLGTSGTQVKMVNIVPDKIIQAYAVSPAFQSATNDEQINFEIKIFPPSTACAGSNAATSSPSLVTVRWEQLTNNVWETLPSQYLPEDNYASFPTHNFVVNTKHQFRATVFAGQANKSIVFDLNVTRAPPRVLLIAPELVPPSCDFRVDASGSYDPAIKSSTSSTLAYSWSCSSTGACPPMPNSSQESVIQVAANSLLPGEYNFTVVGTSSGGLSMTRTSIVRVDQDAAPPFLVVAPWQDGDHMPTSADVPDSVPVVTVQALLQGSGTGCTVDASLSWSWFLQDITAGVFLPLTGTTSGSIHTTTDYRPAALVSGHLYSYLFAGLTTSQAAAIVALQQTGYIPGTDFLQTVNGASRFESPHFYADAPPKGGLVQVAPLSGEEVVSSFSARSGGWRDEVLSTVMYSLVVFKLPDTANVTETASGALNCTGTCSLQVEWYDETASNYWVDMGGQVLKSWDTTAEAIFVLPEGAYVTIGRAKDKLGQEGQSPQFLGPLVKPVGTLTASSVNSVLVQSMSSADDDRILASVQSVNQLMGKVSGAEQQQVAGYLLDGLEKVTQGSFGGSGSVARIGQIVSDMATNGASTASAGLFQRSINLLSSVAASAVGSGTQSVTPQAASSFLGSILSLGEHVTGTVAGADQEAAFHSALETSATNMGHAVARGLTTGRSRQISRVRTQGGRVVGLRQNVGKESPASLSSGCTLLGFLCGSSNLFRRRLQSSSSCTTVTSTLTFWLGNNIYSRAANASTYFVTSTSDIGVLDIQQCGQPALFTGSGGISFSMPFPAAWPSPSAMYQPVCVVYDNTTNSWVTTGLSTVGWTDTNATCTASAAYGAFAVGFELVSSPTVTTTQTSAAAQATPSTTGAAAATVGQESGSNVGAIVGGSVLGGCVLLALAVVVGKTLCGYCRTKSRNAPDAVQELPPSSTGTVKPEVDEEEEGQAMFKHVPEKHPPTLDPTPSSPLRSAADVQASEKQGMQSAVRRYDREPSQRNLEQVERCLLAREARKKVLSEGGEDAKELHKSSSSFAESWTSTRGKAELPLPTALRSHLQRSATPTIPSLPSSLPPSSLELPAEGQEPRQGAHPRSMDALSMASAHPGERHGRGSAASPSPPTSPTGMSPPPSRRAKPLQ